MNIDKLHRLKKHGLNMHFAHVKANIFRQDMVLYPTCLDPLTLAWRYLIDKKLVFLRLHQLGSQCCSSLGVIVRNQSVREGAEEMWWVPNLANVAEKATAVRTLRQ